MSPDNRVRFVDLGAQIESLQPAMTQAIEAVISQGAFIMGPDLARFEALFADYCGVPHAIGVDSGMSALELPLRFLDLQPGDEVITQANTYVATVSAIVEAGGRPVIVDCDEHGGIDVAALEASITRQTPPISPLPIYRRICDIDAVKSLAAARAALVVWAP